LYSIVNQAMLFMLTRKGVMHSYSNTKKIPPFVHYILEHRDEFSGQTYHFVDRNPVELSQLILAVKSYLELKKPREIYIPYPLARFGKSCLEVLVRRMSRLGLEARMPREMMFMEYFFKTQVLSAAKLQHSSYGDPSSEITIYTELPDIIQYYLTRWKHLNLITPAREEVLDAANGVADFLDDPQNLINALHKGEINPFAEYDTLNE
jgi:hypothetical protein